MNYHFKNKPNVTLKNGLWSNCLPPLTIGSSYSNCLCRASGRPFTKAARALPVKLLKATKQYFIIEIHNAGEPLNLFRSYKGFISPKKKKWASKFPIRKKYVYNEKEVSAFRMFGLGFRKSLPGNFPSLAHKSYPSSPVVRNDQNGSISYSTIKGMWAVKSVKANIDLYSQGAVRIQRH